MHIVFGVAWHVVVQDHCDVVDVDASRENVGGDEHIDLSTLEAEHHLVALGLREVAVHLSGIDFHAQEGMIDILHLIDFTGEDNYTLQVSLLEHCLNDLQFLSLVAHVCRLLNLLGGLAHGNLHFHGILQKRLGQLLNLVGHRCREHHRLTSLGQETCNLQDVVGETHVEHTVGLVENKETHFRHVDIVHRQVGDESSWCGNDNRCTRLQGIEFLIVAVAVVTAIDSNGADVRKVVAEALHGLVYLLCELASGSHDDAVDCL